MIRERSKAPVRSISARARSTRSRGRCALEADVDLHRRRRGGSPITVSMDRSGSPAGRSARGRAHVGEHVPAALLAQRGPGHQAAGAPLGSAGAPQALVAPDHRPSASAAGLDARIARVHSAEAPAAEQRRRAPCAASLHTGPPGSAASRRGPAARGQGVLAVRGGSQTLDPQGDEAPTRPEWRPPPSASPPSAQVDRATRRRGPRARARAGWRRTARPPPAPGRWRGGPAPPRSVGTRSWRRPPWRALLAHRLPGWDGSIRCLGDLQRGRR